MLISRGSCSQLNMLRSNNAYTSTYTMLITVITSSTCAYKLLCVGVCVLKGHILVEWEWQWESDISCLLYEQPLHYCSKGLSVCPGGSLLLELTLDWVTPPTASKREIACCRCFVLQSLRAKIDTARNVIPFSNCFPFARRIYFKCSQDRVF